MNTIPGYTYGQDSVARSPVSLEELREVELALCWTNEDAEVLRRHAEIFRLCAEQMVDSWRAVIASQPHLAKWFFGPDGKPEEEYKARVKQRFVQWVVDVCLRPHDQDWLDYQEEIGLRHTPAAKNHTDGAHTPPLVPARFLIAFASVVSVTARAFFLQHGVSGDELQKLQEAWSKSVQLHITLWLHPYMKEGLW